MTKPTLFLLNLPGKAIYLRDYYCSKTSQADYLLPPADLVIQSGFLNDAFELVALDAVASGQSPFDVLKVLEQRRPEVVLFLAGAVSWTEDRAFLAEVARRFPAMRLIGMGDVFLEAGADRLADLPGVEAILLDFTTPDLARYLAGERATLENMVWRDGAVVRESPAPPAPRTHFSIPVPRHELFPPQTYRYPFCRRRRFAVVLTDFGCPFGCRFCVMPGLGYKQRAVENVMAEIRALHGMGIRESLFLDQTFGVGAKRIRQLLEELRPLKMDWTAFTRVDGVEDEILTRMQAAGCHTLILGVESGSEAIRKAQGKGITGEQIRRAFEWCRRHRIRTVATLILGLPEETLATVDETFSFLRNIRPDYCSFNVAVPRRGTALRKMAVERGLVDPQTLDMDQSGTRIAIRTVALSQVEVTWQLRRAIRQFQLHPAYIIKQLAAVRSAHELTLLLRQGAGVLSRFIKFGGGPHEAHS